MEKQDLKQKTTDELCPNKFYENNSFALGEILTIDDLKYYPINNKWYTIFSGNDDLYNWFYERIEKYKGHWVLYYNKKKNNLLLLSVKSDGEVNGAYGIDGDRIKTEGKLWEYGKHLEAIKEHFNSTKNKIDNIQKEAYEVSSELFHFKDLRRGVVEHGKLCYVEGYKKHAELFLTFLVQNGYFTKEELHKVTAEFESYLNGVPAISILTCEDVLRKLKPIIYKNSKVEGDNMPCLNSAQKDIVTIYRDYLKDGKNTLRIMKARQRGISTILSIIAYLETKNEKRVLYIGCDNPTKRLGLKYNQFFTYKESINNIDLSSQHFDIIIVDDPKFYHLELEQLYPSVGKNGKMIIALTPCSPGSRTYSEIKSFFKCDSAGELKYETGKSDNADELISKYPIHKNEFMGEFID